MADKRNRIINIVNYIKSLGIDINIKNNARGNNGFFRFCGKSSYRIDISKKLDDKNILSTIIHEFAHYVHYKYDNKMASLNFIFENYSDEIKEELIKITVNNIPKENAKALFEQKNNIKHDIKYLSNLLKKTYSNFYITKPHKKLESNIPQPFKYLIKYDRINFLGNIYSIDKIETYPLNSDEKTYIILKSKQRHLKRINNKISKLNTYYNKPGELFARFVELYFTNNKLASDLAPFSSKLFELCIQNNQISELSMLQKLLN